jgi:hypothetical protein
MIKFRVGDLVMVIGGDNYIGTKSVIKRIDKRDGMELHILEKQLPIGFWEEQLKLFEIKIIKEEDLIL